MDSVLGIKAVGFRFEALLLRAESLGFRVKGAGCRV